MKLLLVCFAFLASLNAVSYAQLVFGLSAAALATGLAVIGATAVSAGAAGLAAASLGRKFRGFGRRGGGSGRHHYRGRRAVDEVDFDYIKSRDVRGCTLKVVCELETRPEDSLQDDERLLVQLFGDVASTNVMDKKRTTKDEYELAAFIGATSKDPRICRQVAPLCRYSVQDIMVYLRTHNYGVQ